MNKPRSHENTKILARVQPLTIDDIPKVLEVFEKSYIDTDVPVYEFQDFEEELKASFDKSQIHVLEFFGIKQKGELISFAALSNSNFYSGSWELRWGTTHPDYQKQGLMSALVEYRINIAIEKSKNIPGVIHIASRSPNLYKSFGFEPVFTRGPDNKTTYMVKYFNNENNYQITSS